MSSSTMVIMVSFCLRKFLILSIFGVDKDVASGAAPKMLPTKKKNVRKRIYVMHKIVDSRKSGDTVPISKVIKQLDITNYIVICKWPVFSIGNTQIHYISMKTRFQTHGR